LVLEGVLEYRYGTHTGGLKAGQSVMMPKGLEHYFRPVTPEVRLLVRLSPGGLENSFKSFGVAVTESLLPPPRERIPGFAEIAQIFAQKGVFFSSHKSK
jgi:hypothetical protein